jgi:hypothetical protein
MAAARVILLMAPIYYSLVVDRLNSTLSAFVAPALMALVNREGAAAPGPARWTGPGRPIRAVLSSHTLDSQEFIVVMNHLL